MVRRVKKTVPDKTKSCHDKGAIDILEEAIHLLRTASLSTVVCYYIGGLPFVLALLYFWTDMSRSVVAAEHCSAAAFGLAALFLWMKCWQSIFARQLMASLHAVPSSSRPFYRIWNLVITQTIFQPWGMLLLPCSLLLTVPFPWLYAFYQNVTILGGEEGGRVKRVSKQAWQQAKLWPKQNCILIWLLSPWLLVCSAALLLVTLPFLSKAVLAILILFMFFALLFVLVLSPLGAIVAMNIGVLLVMLPGLVKTLFGIETMFTMNPWQMLNSTFFAVVCGLTYLCLDPFVKAVYVVRCFYGKALHTGEDLKVELRQAAQMRRQTSRVLPLAIGFLLAGSSPLWAENPAKIISQNNHAPAVSSQELDRSLQQVLNQPEYAWKMPRQNQGNPTDRHSRPAFLDGMFQTLKGWGTILGEWFSGIQEWLKKVGDWFKKFFPEGDAEGKVVSGHQPFDFLLKSQLLLYTLLAAIVCIVAILFWRAWSARSRVTLDTFAEPERPEPDLTDENVDADRLPPDDWLSLAYNFIEQGELRLALRAFYLAGLASLDDHHLIRIARHKSDLDYENELQRRAHAFPALLELFLENSRIFQRSWYGLHEVSLEAVEQVKMNYNTLKTVVSQGAEEKLV
ncbi:hypothetical protein CSA56_03730 [candidate division KSB3 bacterium]|uniref:DUF4129 domain-containing protein n=1 Tax=candidate division KSB3 bacterium TaxID=2044937 RepID=A0A2G6KKP3_9BACT|nr:MAG: hypothetical protein CSA56_03730 [candidate division KSB3 bacterium]